MKSLLKNKYIVYFLAILVIFFVVNDYANVTADTVAVVVGIGIDQGDDGSFDLSCEVLVPNDETTGGAPKNVVLTGSGGTIAEGLNNAFKKVGWFPKLNYCNILIMSKKVAENSAVNALSYFLKTEKIMDSALVVISGGKAVEILEATTPLDSVSAEAVQKIAKQEQGGSNIIEINLKDFMKNFYDEGVNDILSVVKTKTATSKQSEEEKQKSKKQEMEVFDLTTSAIFFQGKLVAEIDETLTKAFILSKKDAKNTSIYVKDVKIPFVNDGKPNDMTLDILKHKNDVKVKLQNGKIKVQIDVEMEVKLNDSSVREGIFERASVDEVPIAVLTKASEDLKADILKLFRVSQETHADIFEVGKTLHKFDNSNWRQYLINCENQYEYLNECEVEVNVNII